MATPTSTKGDLTLQQILEGGLEFQEGPGSGFNFDRPGMFIGSKWLFATTGHIPCGGVELPGFDFADMSLVNASGAIQKPAATGLTKGTAASFDQLPLNPRVSLDICIFGWRPRVVCSSQQTPILREP